MSKLNNPAEQDVTIIFRLDAETAEWLRKQKNIRRPERVRSINQMARFMIKDLAKTNRKLAA